MYKILHKNKLQSSDAILGGKASGLLFLNEQGFSVPDFYVIPPEAVKEIKNKTLTTDSLLSEWAKSESIDHNQLWAVRSSASVEDGANNSFAGLFHTELNVQYSELPQAISNVLEASEKVKEFTYNVSDDFEFTIVMQAMIQADYSGVIFSQNPFDTTRVEMLVNVIPGMGANLVSGQENAFSFTYYRNKAFFSNTDEDFTGQYYTPKGYQEIQKSGTEIQKEFSKYIKPLTQGAQKLANLRDYAVDIEFAVVQNQIYWLQVRPVTTLSAQTKYIWDNSNIGDNYPALTLPLSSSFVIKSYEKAYSAMAVFLGMDKQSISRNQPLFAQMTGSIHGAMYYNITAWQHLLYQLPFGNRTSKQIASVLGMDEAPFTAPQEKSSASEYLKLFFNTLRAIFFFGKHKKQFEQLYINMLNEFRGKDLSKCSHKELADKFIDLDNRITSHWTVPVLNGFFAMLFLTGLRRMIKGSGMQKEYPNFTNDILFSQGDVVSVQIVREHQNLIRSIQQSTALKTIFGTLELAEIDEKLRTEHPDFHAKILSYIDKYGERSEEGELKMETINYKENPLLFLEVLKANAGFEHTEKLSDFTFDYSKVLRKYYPLNFIKRWMLSFFIQQATGRVRDRENYRFFRTKGFDIVRRIMRQIDKILLENNTIQQAGDSLYLTIDQITQTELSDEYIDIIAAKKQAYASYKSMPLHNRYQQTGDTFAPLERKIQTGLLANIKGTGCCSGMVTAEVVVITPESDRNLNYKDYILVARYFEPGWLNLFAQAKGIVSERGNLLSHTAILCREMGIPSIVGVKGLTTQIKTGDRIQMDGSTGEIALLNNEEQEIPQ